MGLRNTLLIGALIVGLLAIVIIFVRRGFNDLQGQVDAIETMLSNMPPELTSGDSLEYPQPTTNHLAPTMTGGGNDPNPTFTPDDELEEVDENDYIDYDDAPQYRDESPDRDESLDRDEYTIPEYTLSGTIDSIATLSEPGIYETGVTHITVLPAGEDIDMKLDIETDNDETEDEGEEAEGAETDEDEGAEDEDEGAGAEDEDEGAEDEKQYPDILNDDWDDNTIDVSASPLSDEFNMLTLPQLKARLKAVQPDMRGIARMKRAEVMDRLRSLPAEEVE